MVARIRNHTTELVITFTDAQGRVLAQEQCVDGHVASRQAALAIAKRDPMQPGDMLRCTVPTIGDIHQPRETD
jgi:N-methylhydantoinase B/oxoprolinase/acetone carboxylase alpha subunit